MTRLTWKQRAILAESDLDHIDSEMDSLGVPIEGTAGFLCPVERVRRLARQVRADRLSAAPVSSAEPEQ